MALVRMFLLLLSYAAIGAIAVGCIDGLGISGRVALPFALVVAGGVTGSAIPWGDPLPRPVPVLAIGLAGLFGAVYGLGSVNLRVMFGTTDAPGLDIGEASLLLMGLAGLAAFAYGTFMAGFLIGVAAARWRKR